MVSPEGLICYSSDAALNHEVFNRRNDFLKPCDKHSECNPGLPFEGAEVLYCYCSGFANRQSSITTQPGLLEAQDLKLWL